MASNGVQKLMELLLGVTQKITRAMPEDDGRLDVTPENECLQQYKNCKKTKIKWQFFSVIIYCY